MTTPRESIDSDMDGAVTILERASQQLRTAVENEREKRRQADMAAVLVRLDDALHETKIARHSWRYLSEQH